MTFRFNMIAIAMFASYGHLTFASELSVNSQDSEPLLSSQELACAAKFSTATGQLSIPCVNIDNGNETYSAVLQKSVDKLNFSINSATLSNSKDFTFCQAIYNTNTKITEIPCLLIEENGNVTNSSTPYTIYLKLGEGNQEFSLISRADIFEENSVESTRRRWFVGDPVPLPDSASFSNVQKEMCRKKNLKVESNRTITATVYTVLGQKKGGYKQKSDSYTFVLKSSNSSSEYFDSIVSTVQGTSYNNGRTDNFVLATNLPAGNYYWCISGYFNKGTVTLKYQ